jgi:hypothetical protein
MKAAPPLGQFNLSLKPHPLPSLAVAIKAATKPVPFSDSKVSKNNRKGGIAAKKFARFQPLFGHQSKAAKIRAVCRITGKPTQVTNLERWSESHHKTTPTGIMSTSLDMYSVNLHYVAVNSGKVSPTQQVTLCGRGVTMGECSRFH